MGIQTKSFTSHLTFTIKTMLEDEVTTEPAEETKEAPEDKKVPKGQKGKAPKVADKKTPAPKKKKVKTTAASNHPKYSVMIESAIKALKERNGSSRQAILKYIIANYSLESKQAATQLRLSLKRAVAGGSLKMAKESGKGAGCYKLAAPEESKKTKPKKKPESLPPPAKKKEKPKKKVAAKKPETKKAQIVKKPATKKSAPKSSKKSPKKK